MLTDFVSDTIAIDTHVCADIYDNHIVLHDYLKYHSDKLESNSMDLIFCIEKDISIVFCAH